jgi:Na+/H+-dicarboxylate symporter
MSRPAWAGGGGPGTHGLHATDLQVLANVFLRMIKSLIVPLLFGGAR